MKSFPALTLIFLFAASCASASKPAERPAEIALPAAPAPLPEPDCISGKVSSDDEVIGVPRNVEVRLLAGGDEIARQRADEYGHFRFEGPLVKGKYELRGSAGALHGTRALTYAGGALKDVSVVIAKPEKRRHRHRRRH